MNAQPKLGPLIYHAEYYRAIFFQFLLRISFDRTKLIKLQKQIENALVLNAGYIFLCLNILNSKPNSGKNTVGFQERVHSSEQLNYITVNNTMQR